MFFCSKLESSGTLDKPNTGNRTLVAAACSQQLLLYARHQSAVRMVQYCTSVGTQCDSGTSCDAGARARTPAGAAAPCRTSSAARTSNVQVGRWSELRQTLLRTKRIGDQLLNNLCMTCSHYNSMSSPAASLKMTAWCCTRTPVRSVHNSPEHLWSQVGAAAATTACPIHQQQCIAW